MNKTDIMAQSDKERIEELENKLAAMSYRIEDIQKEWEERFAAIGNHKEPDKEPFMDSSALDATKAIYDRYAKFEGADCSCSPKGMPHSVHCKGYWSGPTFEDLAHLINKNKL